MKRIAMAVVLCVMTSVAAVAVASPAFAAAQSKVWVDAVGQLHYQYTPTAPAVNLRVRSSGSTFIVEDDFGLYLPAGSGCWYPTQYATLVHCAGLVTYGDAIIDTGPYNDAVDFWPTGAYAGVGTRVNLYGGNDQFYGGDGPDEVIGGDGNDILYGYGSLLDKFWPEGGADTVYGGAGYDEVHYEHSPAGVVADLDGAIGDDGMPGEGDTLGTDIEGIIGSPYNDKLTGNGSNNDIYGCGGSDQLYGLGGNDTFSGDSGSCGTRGGDIMVGGLGIDRVAYTERTVGVVVDLAGTTANDGEPGEGDLVGADVEEIMGGTGADILVGNSSANWIDGYLGADLIYGLDGGDTLRGSDDDDQLYGGNGADNLDGGGGFHDYCDAGPGGLTVVNCE